tara:strand:- start:4999 stop:5775 length:777 start_codon:yes stop_codon:yes gene_type:complete
MKRVFVIGGKRFVGAAVVKLLSTKYDVTVLNRSGIKPTDNCTVIQMDRVNISSFLLRNQDIIIDMCAYNLTQVKELLKVCSHRHQYILMSSIASQYGFFGNYGKNKAEIEKFLRFETDIPNTILRPTYIIGDNDHNKRIDYFLDCINDKTPIEISGDGDKKMSFVFEDDVAKVVCEVVNRGIVGKTYNICNDEDISMMELVELFFKIVKDKTNIETSQSYAIFENEECIFSNKLVKSDLEIKFKTLEEGIREYIISKS